MKSVFILGRQPAIGRAEVESLYGETGNLSRIGEEVVASDLPVSGIDFARLGGTIKVGEVIGNVSAEWQQLCNQLAQVAVNAAQTLTQGKVQIGVSVYGLHTSPARLTALGLQLKKALRNHHYSVRLTPNKEVTLSSAQVIHNHLTGERGIELLLIRQGQQLIVARTTAVQDIAAYAARDQGRPKRDARVGMLPPKLAQTIVNLATGSLAPAADRAVLDPFCGTGVVLQEALLMGYGAYGTDLETRMIDYTKQNLEWLATGSTPDLEVGDATTLTWQHPMAVIASETYLGSPLTGWPRPEKLHQITGNCNVILEKFLRNIGAQIPAGTRLCLAMPAWKSPEGKIHHLPLLDRLEEIGYNQVSFSLAKSGELVYYRPDQIVARELVVIIRK